MKIYQPPLFDTHVYRTFPDFYSAFSWLVLKQNPNLTNRMKLTILVQSLRPYKNRQFMSRMFKRLNANDTLTIETVAGELAFSINSYDDNRAALFLYVGNHSFNHNGTYNQVNLMPRLKIAVKRSKED